METLTLPWRIFPKTIEAACYNRGRLVQLRLGYPPRISLQQHRGLEVILDKAMWLCVDSNTDDQPILAWREFQIRGRCSIHLPVSCELWLYHSCAGLIMGSALDDLDQALEKIMHWDNFWLDGDEQLSAAARNLIGEASHSVLASAVSAWEIATKVRIGKLPGAVEVAARYHECLMAQGFTPLDISTEHALRAGSLPGPHRGPFDRMLIAQAQAFNVPIISNERIFDNYGSRRIW